MSNMQQYGAAKNPPWARNPAGQNMPGLQQPMMNQASLAGLGQGMIQYPQAQSLFQPNMIQQQANMTMGMSQMKQNNVGVNPMGQIGQGQMYSQSGVVSYPAPRSLNPNAFNNVPQSNQTSSNSPKQRVFSGTVTACHHKFGFVDDDIFFQRSVCVKGDSPMVGDKVLVEAAYNANMPFKWNATRIQVLPTSKNSSGPSRDTNNVTPNKSPYNSVPPPNDSQQSSSYNNNMAFKWGSTNKNSSSRDTGRSNVTPNKSTYSSVSSPNDSQHDGFDSSKNRNRKPQSGGRESRRNRRSEEPKREEIDRSRRETRERDRDADERPKEKDRERERRIRSPSVRSEKRKRSRPVPRYAVRVPKIALDIPEANVLEVRRRYMSLYIPSDFFNTQFRWIDAFPPDSPFPLINPCCFHTIPKDVNCPMIDKEAILEPNDIDYAFSAKVMLLSMPLIDEVYRKCCNLEYDEKDYVHPTRLISFLVGLRNKNETMAIGGPWSPSLDGPNPGADPNTLIKTAIRTCKALTGIDLSNCTQWYRFMELYYRRAESAHRGKVVPARVETVVIYVPDIWSCLPTRSEWEEQLNAFKLLLEPAPVASSHQDQAEKNVKKPSVKKEPTPFTDLDPKAMAITDLRKELEARNISSKGLIKSQLIAKLSKELKKEEAEGGNGNIEIRDDDDAEGVDNQEVIAIDDETQEEEDEKAKQDKDKALHKVVNNLPENPHILVHPSRTAKSGKFDCTAMTLSLLLDYRQEDSKEHSFEVSLFAELFNEMLMRDFGFNIYKALYVMPEKPKDEKKDSKVDGKDSKEGGSKDKDGSKDREEKKDGEKEKRDDRSKKDKDDLSIDDDNSNDKKYGEGRRDKKDKPKMVTKDPALLLSFVYFDTTHCGYFFEKDIEELLFTLGLNLSRSQVKKLVSKVVNRDSFHYRQLTDRPKDEEESAKKPEGDPVNIDLTELAAGNKTLLPVFKYNDGYDHVPSGDGDEAEPPSKKTKTEEENHMISYKGRLFDIDKLLAQLKRSEQARLETESRLSELKSENGKLQDKLGRVQTTSSSLSHELNANKKKLTDVQSQLSKNAMCTKIFLSALKDIDVKVQSVIHTNLYDENKIENSSSRWNDESSKKDVIIIDHEKPAHGNKSDSDDKKDQIIVIDGDKMDIASDDGAESKTTTTPSDSKE